MPKRSTSTVYASTNKQIYVHISGNIRTYIREYTYIYQGMDLPVEVDAEEGSYLRLIDLCITQL